MSETIIKDVEQFDIIGSVEVTNKIASGFSVDSYLKLNKWFILNIYLKFYIFK